MTLDKSAIISALFLPLLIWTGSVIAITGMGYPGVVWMTPLAWLLAMPVGLRVRRESVSPGHGPTLEAALGGGLLGFWQAMLVPAVMVASPHLPMNKTFGTTHPILAMVLMILTSISVTAGLSALIAAFIKRDNHSG